MFVGFHPSCVNHLAELLNGFFPPENALKVS